MTTISATVVAASKNRVAELYTLALRYPLIIHNELMTHRVFSRNASSSRAIPVERMIEEATRDPFVPLFWSRNQKGMSADNEDWNELIRIPVIPNLSGPDAEVPQKLKYETVTREQAWLRARDDAVSWARAFSASDYHKQLCNRLLGPFIHINTLVSSTKWKNWDWLRMHRAAEPHIRLLATEVHEARNRLTPKPLEDGEWHTPYLTQEDLYHPMLNGYRPMDVIGKALSMRCARLSYKTFDDKEPDLVRDIEDYERNLVSPDPENPPHASPCEHIAMSDADGNFRNEWGNFRGFAQWRKLYVHNEDGDA